MKPWVKLFRQQSARFRAMSSTTRAYHHLMLLEADDDGCIHIGNLSPVAAIQRLLANDRSDRRAIAKVVPELIENGYLAHDNDRLVFVKFAARQSDKKSRSGHDRATTVPPSGHDAATTVPRSGHELSDNPPESLKTAPGDKDKEGDKKEKRINFPSSADAEAPKEPSDSEQIRELQARYPADLVADVRDAVALTRRSGKIADSVWLRTLRKLEAHPVQASTEAMRKYVERYADGEKTESYLVAIARNLAKGGPGPVQTRLTAASSGLSPVSSDEEHRRDMEQQQIPAWMMGGVASA